MDVEDTRQPATHTHTHTVYINVYNIDVFIDQACLAVCLAVTSYALPKLEPPNTNGVVFQ